MSAKIFQPDPFLVAAAVRPDGVFAYHSALDLLGVGHSLWQRYVLYTDRRRRSLQVNTAELCFLDHLGCMQVKSCKKLGLRQVEYRGKMLRVTGPERTLVEGFRRLAEVGGIEEMVASAAGFFSS